MIFDFLLVVFVVLSDPSSDASPPVTSPERRRRIALTRATSSRGLNGFVT
jgi:hypothetical protein